MSLPSIKNASFTVKLKEFAKPIKVRPMIVSEHKSIQQAIDIGSESDVAITIADVTNSCTSGAVTGENQPQYILEYIFLQLYMTSVENVISSKYHCHNHLKNLETSELMYDEETGDPIKCDNSIEVKLPISNAKIMYPENFEQDSLVEIDSNIKMKLRGLSLAANVEINDLRSNIVALIESVHKIANKPEDQITEEEKNVIKEVDKKLIEIKKEVQNCYFYNAVEYIDNNGVILYPEKDFTEETFTPWLNSCPSTAYSKIQDFYEKTPGLGLDIKITCPKCGNSTTSELRGLQDFFS